MGLWHAVLDRLEEGAARKHDKIEKDTATDKDNETVSKAQRSGAKA